MGKYLIRKMRALLRDLCALTGESRKEIPVCAYITSYLRKRHIPYIQDPYGYIYVALAGESAYTLAFVAHMDEVEREGSDIHVEEEYICAPALDDRIGCALLLHLIEAAMRLSIRRYSLLFLFTVREEIGETLPYYWSRVDEIFVLDVTEPQDHPFTRLRIGKGPVLTLLDLQGKKDLPILAHLCDLACMCKIPLQYEITFAGGTDEDRLLAFYTPRVNVICGVCVENMHTPRSLAAWQDIFDLKALLTYYIGIRLEVLP